MEKPSPQDTDLIKLVDRYKAMLEDIAHCKLRAAALGGSTTARKKMKQELDVKSREAEELEREIDELRARIVSRESEIRRLGKPGLS
jgi:chromosome segregation ATPase